MAKKMCLLLFLLALALVNTASTYVPGLDSVSQNRVVAVIYEGVLLA